MHVAPNDGLPIEGQQLTTWAVLPGGTQVRLDFVAADGRTHCIVLPFDALSGLLMTLPRMLQSALDAQFADGSLRLVQRLGTWRLEPMQGDSGVILQLGTQDGFEVAFAVNDEHASSLGAALLAPPSEQKADDNKATEKRRPH
jgi:hypothetical protein